MIVEHISKYIRDQIKPWQLIVDQIIGDCPPGMWGMAQGVRVFSGEVLVALLSFGWSDVARGALRPRGIRPRSHLRNSKKNKPGRGLPEIGNEIGKKAGDALEIRGRAVSEGVKKLWIADAVLQRIGYWILITETVRKSAYRATNAMREYTYCQESIGPARWRSHDVRFTRPPLSTHWELSGFTVDYAQGGVLPAGWDMSISPGPLPVSASANVTVNAGIDTATIEVTLAAANLATGYSITDKRSVTLAAFTSESFTLTVQGTFHVVTCFPSSDPALANFLSRVTLDDFIGTSGTANNPP